MRIALFSEVYWPMVSGVALTLRRLADALSARGHGVRVYSADYPVPEGETERAEVHRSPGRQIFFCPDIRWAFTNRLEIARDMRAFRPDVVHLATEFAMGFAGLRAAQEMHLPVVASAHTDYERYAARYGFAWAVRPGWPYLRWFYRHAHRVLCPTGIYERFLHSRGVTHTGVWTRGVNTEEFSPQHRSEAFRARAGAGPDDPIVAYVGRLAPEKNLPLLLESWAELHQRHPKARLVLVGEGLMENAIRQAELPNVHMTGYVHGPALAEAYASADIFAFPSTTETFGNVLIEAMASGLASVAANAGGIPEFAIDGHNALLAAPDDRASLTACLDRVLSDVPLRRRLGQGARTTALNRQWGAIYDGLLGDYAEAIEARKVRRAA